MFRRILPFLFVAVTMGQPPTDPVPPEIAPYNVDGSTVWPMLNALDPRAWLDGYASAIQFQENLIASTPIAPSNLAATVSGTQVLLTWTLPTPSAPRTNILVERNPTWTTSPTVPGTATGLSDNPGSGTWQYRVSAVQVIGTKVYPSVWTPWVSVTVAGNPPPPSSGWTDLTLPPGAASFYVSSSSGADTNSGASSSSPLKTIAAGYAKLRDGQPDQLLLKCGDTWGEAFPRWSKGSRSTSSYMVVSSYGTGARPRLRPPQGTTCIDLAAVTGVAFVDLDMEPATPGGANYSGVNHLGGMKHVLFEGLLVSKFPGNFVIQDISNANVRTIDDVKIRRCVIVNSYDTGTGHSQGIYLANTSNWIVEGCVLDSNALNKADIFCHSLYAQSDDGPGIFRDNISSRACSHGIQQRAGGDIINNLFIQNPVNAYQGESQGAYNRFNYNVAIDSRNINATDVRGSAYEFGSAAAGAEYLNNIAAYQRTGTGNVAAFQWSGSNGPLTIKGNYVYDWSYPNGNCAAPAYAWYSGGTGTAIFDGNTGIMPAGGNCVLHDSRDLGTWITYRNNKWYRLAGGSCFYSIWSRANGSGTNDAAVWRSWTGGNDALLTTAADPGAGFQQYMTSIGQTGGMVEFITAARLNSKQNWDVRFTAPNFNTWCRTRCGVAQPTANP